MNTPNSSEMKKVMIVIVIFIVLLISFLIIKFNRNNTNKIFTKIEPTTPIAITESVTKNKLPEVPLAGIMMFNNVPKSVKSGDEFDVTVDFSADGKILDGADAIIHFDQSKIKVLEIIDGPYFQLYPRKTIDNDNGIVKVTAFQARDDKLIRNQIELFTMKLKAKKVGTSSLTFDFIKGKTNLSTIVEKGTSRNILGNIRNAEIKAIL